MYLYWLHIQLYKIDTTIDLTKERGYLSILLYRYSNDSYFYNLQWKIIVFYKNQ